MKKIIKLLLVVTLLITFQSLTAQSNKQKCVRMYQIFNNKPKEVHFSVNYDKNDGNLYFQVTDRNWFQQLFKSTGDGLGVDIVSKDRYMCDIMDIEPSQIRGEIIPPIYTLELRKRLRPYKNIFRAKIVKLPEQFVGRENDLEFNMLFIGNKELCRYQTLYDLNSYPWDLLDMGMYLDSLTYKTKIGTSIEKEGYTLKFKTLKFRVPFEKNKYEYSNEDIKPMYDSLRLTDFNIKKIQIKAYSSVEGNLERNIELQEKRAKSIVKALQSFQKPTIVTNVESSENWVEFYEDIKNTDYSGLAGLNKDQIKNKLVGKFSSDLEKYLKNHRKAVITLELEKKDKFKEISPQALLELFNKAIKNSELEKAVEIQNSIFEKLKKEEISPDFLSNMHIPNQVKFTGILNKNAVIKYLIDKAYLLIAYKELQRIEKIAPKDPKIKYNLVAMKFRFWYHNVQPIDENQFQREINNLKNFGIKKQLIDRMFINFHIVRAKDRMSKRDYQSKDISVRYIYNNYKKIPLTDFDKLSLGQFLTYYSNNTYAIDLLKDRVKQIDVDEDLLFYYINLTIVNKDLTGTSDYRTMLLNAVNMNKERFCKLFNSNRNGGVTFQLLENSYLRGVYCENCEKS